MSRSRASLSLAPFVATHLDALAIVNLEFPLGTGADMVGLIALMTPVISIR
jgi:hypothetical protein